MRSIHQADISQATRDVLAERERQINSEGWTPFHDDAHDSGELLDAARCYFDHAMGRATYRSDGKPMGWPWDCIWWKPKDKRRDLVRAGALCRAEAARLIRIIQSTHTGHLDQSPRLLLGEIISEIERIDRALLAKDHPND